MVYTWKCIDGSQILLHPDWDAVKMGLMKEIARAKFIQNPHLAGKLLATDNRQIAEGNTWGDTYWGVDIQTGKGENHLGQILM